MVGEPGDASKAEVRNPFDSEAVAQRYKHGRLYYHQAALHLAMRHLGVARVADGLDLGCGTGLSARALRTFADRVVAVDVSTIMLLEAEQSPGIHYAAAAAEQLPFRDASLDLVTCGTAWHWFDQSRVFTELARVLRPHAALVVYLDNFKGPQHRAFAHWFANGFRPRFPTVPRNAHFDAELAATAGFGDTTYVEDEVEMPLSRTKVADYLLSQSYCQPAIESAGHHAEEFRRGLIDELAAYFPGDEPSPVVFGIRAWCTMFTS